jgi:hypothetical protein
MTDATPADTLAATATDTAAADSAGSRNSEDKTLLGKLSAALTGIADVNGQEIGCWPTSR